MSARFDKYQAQQVPFPDVALPDPTGLARKLAAQPLHAPAPQEPCDIGLFSDEASQTDLVVLANQARKT